MSVLSDTVERLRALLFRRREEREMDEEMRFHMEMAGRQAFGGMEQHKEEVRDARGTRMVEELVADFNWSIRTLIRRPRFTIIAIVTLALGVGGVTAVFSAVDAVLLRPLPYANASQFVRIYGTSVTNPDLRTFVSTPHFLASARAAVALTLAAVGLFGILSYVVTLRGKEIGIRVALGAGRGTIRSMVLRQGLTLTVIGIAAGLFGAITLSKVIASLLFGTSALDPLVLAGAVFFMGLVAAIAAWFPARRATAVDPRTVLQGE